MFGFVLPYKPELKMREWQEYRSVYCGLCKEIKRNYGIFARMVLNYDFVLLSLMADNLSGEIIDCKIENCIANPIKKRPVCKHTKGLELASHTLMLTVFYKIIDNIHDDKFLKRLPSYFLYPLAKNKRNKAQKLYSNFDETLNLQTKRQIIIEQAKTCSYDEAADATSIMLGSLFALAGTKKEYTALYRFGQFLGKIIYYLDAAQDYDEDIKNGSYNVFVINGLTKTQAILKAKELCNICAYEMSLAYTLLKRAHHSPVLDNIIYLGIPYNIENAGILIKQKITNN